MIDDLFEQLAQPLLSQYLRTAVTHYPLGVVGDATPIDAVVAGRETRESSERGYRTEYRLVLDIPSGVVVRPSDLWSIGGEIYNTDRDGIGPVAGGFRQITVTRPKPKTTTVNGRQHETP